MTISTAAAPAGEHAAPRPRLLKRQISEAQREAARRNGAKSRGPASAGGKAQSLGNARKHGLYARLHLLTPEETEALQLPIQGYLDSPHAQNPAAVPILKIMAFAAFQQRRALGLETALVARHELIPTGAALRLWNAIDVFESRYGRLFFRSFDRLIKLISCKQTPESIEKKEIAQIGDLRRDSYGIFGGWSDRGLPLVLAGWRRIAHLRGPENSTSVLRYKGYRAALRQAGVRVPAGYVAGGSDADDAVANATMQLLHHSPMPDAIFCDNDQIAIAALRSILAAKLRVPQDVALVGVGNIRYSDVLSVPLTTISQQPQTIGETAAKLLLDNPDGAPARQVLRPARLIVRESSACAAFAAVGTAAEFLNDMENL